MHILCQRPTPNACQVILPFSSFSSSLYSLFVLPLNHPSSHLCSWAHANTMEITWLWGKILLNGGGLAVWESPEAIDPLCTEGVSSARHQIGSGRNITIISSNVWHELFKWCLRPTGAAARQSRWCFSPSANEHTIAFTHIYSVSQERGRCACINRYRVTRLHSRCESTDYYITFTLRRAGWNTLTLTSPQGWL